MEAEILAALDANPELRTDRKQRIVDALRENPTQSSRPDTELARFNE